MRPTSTLNTRLGYLSGAPRISTHPQAEISGPRAHILGCIRAKETLGWQVNPFIVGDRVPTAWVTGKSERAMSGGLPRALALDLARITLGMKYAREAWRELGGQVDWVYERFAPFQALGRPFKRRGVPWVLETHAPLFYEAKTERKTTVLHGIARRLEVQAYRDCDALVCVTEALKSLVIEASGISADKVVVVPNGVDTERFNPAQATPKRLFPHLTVGFVGRLYSWHGLDLLLNAIHELKLEGITIGLVVVGDGLMRPEWETLAQTLELGSQVAFVGQVPWSEVPNYIAGFDVGYTGQIKMQVGKMYHSPLKLYEYMAMAKPVIASAFEDARRTLDNGETGFLYTPGDKADLKRALTQAHHQHQQLAAMGDRARQIAIDHHSWVARMSTMMNELEDILAARSPASALSAQLS